MRSLSLEHIVFVWKLTKTQAELFLYDTPAQGHESSSTIRKATKEQRNGNHIIRETLTHR